MGIDNVGAIEYDSRITTNQLKKDAAEVDRLAKKAGDNLADHTDSGASRAGEALKKFGKVAAVALAATGAAAVAFGVSSAKAFIESENAIAQTEAVLKSTKGVAGVTAEAITNLANSLQRQTRYGDEAIRSAQNMLLTFTNIGKKTFPDATEAVLDMATAMGTDLNSTAIQVGKALQDPVRGATALQRVGVRLSESQKDLIQKFVDAGDAAGAQAIILKELQTEFGGSAKAAGQTFAGQLERLKNQLGDVQEGIGELILRGVGPLVSGFLKLYDSVGGTDGIVKSINTTLAPFLSNLKQWYKNVTAVAKQIAEYLVPKLEALGNTISDNVIPALQNLWRNVIKPMLPVIGSALVKAVGAAIDVMNAAGKVVGFLGNHLDAIIPVLAGVATAFVGLKAAMIINSSINTVIIAFNTLRLITIPSLMVSLAALQAFFMTPWGLALTAAVIGIVALTNGFISNKTNADKLRDANKQLAQSNRDLKTAQDQLINSQLGVEGASLNVESAQKRYNDSVQQFGPKSLEARQALHDLKQAQFDLKTAQQESLDSLQALSDKQKEVAKNKELVNHLKDIQSNLQGVGKDAFDAGQKIERINGSKITVKTAKNAVGQETIDFVSTFGRREKGGPVSANTPYIVGEKRPELFVPRTSGTIIPEVPSGSSKTIENNIGNIYLANDVDVDRFMEKLTGASETISKGLVPQRRYA